MRAEALRRRELDHQNSPYDRDSEDEAEEQSHLCMESRGEEQPLEYRVASTGACVSLSNAKSLLFYFCSKLPSDR